MVDIYYIGNDNLIELTGMRDAVQGLFLNDAAVTLTLVDAETDTEVAGQIWPETMLYVEDSNGDYHLTLEYDLVVEESQHLIAKVEATAGVGLHLSLRLPVIALHREGN
jgi:hypothetical protein